MSSPTPAEIASLIDACFDAQKHSYAKYSNFHVGAALLTPDGKQFKGCNVENVSYGVTNCAERTAYFKAISEGYQKFKAIALIGELGDKYITPCGACRQVMAEFGDITVIMANDKKEYKTKMLSELLPDAFDF